MYGIALNKVNM